MKHNNYIVLFANGKVVYTSAFNKEEAKILAQAFMIKNAMDYEVMSINETTKMNFEIKIDYMA
jgi:predicted outer membrane lipoprotein